MSIMELTDDEANNISRAKSLLRIVQDLSAPSWLNDKDAMREIDRESLAVFMGVVNELLPARF
jgi:hypothetical protein